jgi:hypothetical protein
MLVNDCSFARPVDFKRSFEVRRGLPRRIPAAIDLTGAAAMHINYPFRTKGTSVRTFVATSLILVSKRTAGGG